MSVRLHLRRIRVIAVLVDLIERLVVEIVDTRRVVRCPHCGFKTARVHDSRRLARQLVRDVNAMSIREVAHRHDLPWHFIMALTASWSERVSGERRRRHCRTLLLDVGTTLRRGHRYVTVLINGDTGETLGIVAHRDAAALSGFVQAQGHRWLRGVRVVVSYGSKAYRSAIGRHLGHATHVLDRFHVARWFAAGMIEVRGRVQRIGDKESRAAFEPHIFRSRYLQLTRADHLTEDQTARLGHVLSGRPTSPPERSSSHPACHHHHDRGSKDPSQLTAQYQLAQLHNRPPAWPAGESRPGGASTGGYGPDRRNSIDSPGPVVHTIV